MNTIKVLFTAFLLVGTQVYSAAFILPFSAEDDSIQVAAKLTSTIKLLPEDGPDQLAEQLKQHPNACILDLSDNMKIMPHYIIVINFSQHVNIIFNKKHGRESQKHLIAGLLAGNDHINEVLLNSCLFIRSSKVFNITLIAPALVTELRIIDSSFSGEDLSLFPKLELLALKDSRDQKFKFENLQSCKSLERFYITYYHGEDKTPSWFENYKTEDKKCLFSAHPKLREANIEFYFTTGERPRFIEWKRETPILEIASASSEASAAVTD